MIKTPERLFIPSVSGKKVEVDCNWCVGVNGDYLKIRLGDEETIVPRDAFSRVAMWLASQEEQEALIPTKQVPVRHLTKNVTIKLTKNLKRGERITIPVSFDIPLNGDSLPIIT